MDVPKSILYAENLSHSSDLVKNVKSHFRTKVVVREDCISLKGECAPNVVGLFKGKPDSTCPMNKYDCDLPDLPIVLLQQEISSFLVVVITRTMDINTARSASGVNGTILTRADEILARMYGL
ncbi:hypothetical protein BC332_32711 [Capsicum chinense]|nr:hypothetical protein BC332_32711 [Capsicum chinense]